MSKIWTWIKAALKYLLDWLLRKKQEADTANEQAQSVIDSQNEENKVDDEHNQIDEEDSDVQDDPDGGISFDSFNRK